MTVAAFKERFLPLHPRLYRLAFSLVENSSDAEDVLQEVYLKLWSKRKELSAIINVEAYCVTLVRNTSIDRLRNARPGLLAKQEDVADEASASSPETTAIRREELALVKQLIDRLPDNQRKVLRLYGLKEYSLREIEQITGLSSINVRVLLSRARKIIREQFLQLSSYERI
ncbi:MAG: RNA polymerase sigma factor [Tannerellaceae bacterium]|jgi:RNA polymerase sigma-70 factor (ECF subfamily)|nr:RNA polymerase sigma factor [Tannerellaceae bacterium]